MRPLREGAGGRAFDKRDMLVIRKPFHKRVRGPRVRPCFRPSLRVTLFMGVMVKSIFAKITDAKRFLCFLMIKNTPAERKSPWDNHKSLRSFSSISTSCSSSHSSNTSSAAQTFVVIPGTFPFSWSVFYRQKNIKIAWHQ